MKFPSDWVTVRLGEVVLDTQPGFAQAPSDNDTGMGQIRTHNVSPEGTISLAELKYVTPSEQELKKYLLQKGDIVFNNTNSEEWVGKAALYDLDESLAFSNHMTRIRVNEELTDPDFLARYLHFLWKIGFSKTRAKRWVSQAAIDQRELAFFRIPLPVLSEQKRIVEILKRSDALRRWRREILDDIIFLKEVAFYEMFGVPEAGANKVPLTELAVINPPIQGVDLEIDTEVSFLPMSAIDEVTGKTTEYEIRRYADVKTGYTPFQEGDVLFAKITPCMENGKAAIATGLTNMVGFGSTEYHVLRPINGCTSEFLLGLVRRAEFRRLARRFFVGTSGHQRVAESFLRNHRVAAPGEIALKEYSDFVHQVDSLFEHGREHASIADQLDAMTRARAFNGELTESWREAHHEELESWRREHADQLGKRPARVKSSVIASPERNQPVRPTRRWLMGQLSEVQNHVYLALQEWKGTLTPPTDLDEFLGQWPIEHLDDAQDQLRRALDQLAGLGLVAKVSLPTDGGEYVTGYRVLREAELSKADDLERLGA